jgi:hypothetical protein
VITLAENAKKLCSIPGEEHGSYTVYLLYSLSHSITLYRTAVLVESLIFLLFNQQRWRSDVKQKQRFAAWLNLTTYQMEWQWMSVKYW